MKTSLFAGALTLCLTLGIFSPALADGDQPLDTVVDGSLIVTRVGGVGAAIVLGAPVAAVRSSYKNYVGWTGALADKAPGGKDCGPVCAAVSLVTLPAALLVGGAEGLFYGSKNAFMKGFDAPFHPNSFSLGKEFDE